MISEVLHIFKTNRKIRIILIVILLAVGIFWVFMQDIFQKDVADLPKIIKRGWLAVVVDDSSTGFMMRNDSVYGFEYEIIKAFADTLGVELRITRNNDIKKALESLKKGEYDLVVKFIPNTAEAQQGVTLTQPIFKTRQVLVQRKNQNTDSLSRYISKQYELGNDTVYLPSNSLYRQRIENLMYEIADTIFIVERSNVSTEAMVAMVAEGKIPRTICPEIFANRYEKIYPNLDFSLPVSFTQEQCWAVNVHAPHLKEKINNFIADFQGSMAYWELCRKYY